MYLSSVLKLTEYKNGIRKFSGLIWTDCSIILFNSKNHKQNIGKKQNSIIVIWSNFLTKTQNKDRPHYKTSKLSTSNISCSVQNPVSFRVWRYLLWQQHLYIKNEQSFYWKTNSSLHLEWQIFLCSGTQKRWSYLKLYKMVWFWLLVF